MNAGIKACGVHLPRRRMSRAAIADAHAWAFPALKALGKGEKTLCAWDEDVITMAVEAGRNCLAKPKDAAVTALTLASTSAPFADLQNAVIVAGALRLPSTLNSADASGSTRAGLSALIRALQSNAEGDRLVIAAEKRKAKPGSVQEMNYGSGAAAMLVGSADDALARYLGSEALTVPFFDHFRQHGDKFDYYWEERWIRDEGVVKLVPKTVNSVLTRLGISADRVAHFGLTGGPTGSDKLVAKLLSIAPERVLPDLHSQVGDTGAAQSLLLLTAALERAQPGEVIVIASFAQGCEVLVLEMQNAMAPTTQRSLALNLEQRIPETAYLKMLSFEGEIDLDWGMRAEVDNKTALTQSYRSADQILGFVGGRCEACGAVQFPRLPSCVNCAAVNSQQPFPLADVPATIATFTADWLQYSPSPPLYMGLVQFEVGARLLMEIVDVGPQGIEVGTPLAMNFRIKERDRTRHFDRYFWKAVPLV